MRGRFRFWVVAQGLGALSGQLGGRDSVHFAFVNGLRWGYSSDVLRMLENLEDGEETPGGALFGLVCLGRTPGQLGCGSSATMGSPLHACQVVLACDSHNY